MDQLRREFWRHGSSKNLWAVEVSGRDESVLACCGPFTPRAAGVVALDDLAYRRGPTVDWLRAHRGEFERYDGSADTRPVTGPREGVVSDEALDILLGEARGLTRAEAGTAFLREAVRLRFAASHNEALERRHGWVDARRRLTSASLPLDERSIASYVLFTHTTVSMPNAYEIAVDLPYVFNPEWDRLNDYWTRSVLAQPIRSARGDVIGVLQLINARDEAGTVVPFSSAMADAVAQLLMEWAQRFA
ncbi:MAG TPA: GAF domain-containing protein [Methylomirabilota bacterium]|jgi:hypothetical protein|nr:GAF domain-containing protein [Methylomirabilota bacterium]